jgi:endonuclease-3 related protein
MSECTITHLVSFYSALKDAHGLQHWWPSESAFETIIGAILAQSVSWTGAHKAVCALKDAGLLEPHLLFKAGPDTIAPLIRSSLYYNQKARKIMIFLSWFLDTCDGEISKMASLPCLTVREELLQLSGFGPETVDSILLYALEKPVFVADAYTRRIGSRQGWFSEDITYAGMQEFFMSRLPQDIPLYNDFHAQIVYLGNRICKKNPGCSSCPVRDHGIIQCRYAHNMNR